MGRPLAAAAGVAPTHEAPSLTHALVNGGGQRALFAAPAAFC